MEKLAKLETIRNSSRITARQFMENILDDFVELHGDRLYGDDKAIVGGLGMINDIPITLIMEEKGRTLEEKIECNFGMPHPEGYRKSLRLIKSAEKFKRPIITIIDTAGAYPGIESEKRGQASAIANMLYELSDLSVPVIAIILSEGGSGGALALGVVDYMFCLENAYYSVISPEGYAEILYKSQKEVKDIIDDLPIFSEDLLKLKIIDEIIKEPEDGLEYPMTDIYSHNVKEKLYSKIKELKNKKAQDLINSRYERFRKFGK